MLRGPVLTRMRGWADMDERDARQVAEKLWRALQAGDWETAGDCLHDDFVQEWPQSGERIIGRDNAIAIEQNFPGGLPTMRFGRTLAGGDRVVERSSPEVATMPLCKWLHWEEPDGGRCQGAQGPPQPLPGPGA
jgi:hypothetical protein